MPIRSNINIGADSEKFKTSFELFKKYQEALKEQYGAYVLQAPHVKATAEAGGKVEKLIDLNKAARSQTNFAASAQKASLTFKGLASGVKQTLEGFARVALSPLEILFPAGLAIGLFGLGAGLVGTGTFFGLERGAAGVSDRRRTAMGLGVSYGALSSYELNFQRFGVGEGTLGAVSGGIHDVTSPEYLGLLSAGATGRGDTTQASIDLIRSIPKIFAGVPDSQTGPVARAHNLDSLLDLSTIVRLKNHPEEIDEQIKRYRLDRAALDISKDAQEKWSAFNATISSAGQQIESAFGRLLGSGAGSGPHPRGGSQEGIISPLSALSEGVVNIIDALIDSGTATDAIKGIESGLGRIDSYIGSSEFKEDGKKFLSAIEALEPYADAIAKVVGAAGSVVIGGIEIATGAGEQKDVPPSRTSTGLGSSSIRFYAGRGGQRPSSSGVVDESTGQLVGRPGWGGGWNASAGDIPPKLLAQVQAANPDLSPGQCVALVQSMMGVGNVHDWRRGPSEKDSPVGSALATFGYHGESDRYALGGSGTPGIGRDHALKMIRKYPDGSFDALSQDIGHAPHLVHVPNTGKGGEGDASSYYSIYNSSGRPAGENAHILNQMHNGSPPGPITVHDQTGGSVHVTVSRHEATQ